MQYITLPLSNVISARFCRHLGYCNEQYSPLYRGFDSFLGYLNGAEDYWEHTRADATSHGPQLDFRNGSGANTVPPAYNKSWGVYSSVVFGAEVARIATHHGATASATPLFVYLPFQSVHGPLQAPLKYIHDYNEVSFQWKNPDLLLRNPDLLSGILIFY